MFVGLFKGTQVPAVDPEETRKSVQVASTDSKPIEENLGVDISASLDDMDLGEIDGAAIQETSKAKITSYKERAPTDADRTVTVTSSHQVSPPDTPSSAREVQQGSVKLSEPTRIYRRRSQNSAGSFEAQVVPDFGQKTPFSIPTWFTFVNDQFRKEPTEQVATRILMTEEVISSNSKVVFFVPKLASDPPDDCDLVAMVDVSGSMDSQVLNHRSASVQIPLEANKKAKTRLDICKDGLVEIVESLKKSGANHRMAIGKFDHFSSFDTAGLLNVSEKSEDLQKVISKLKVCGGTDIFEAFKTALCGFAKTEEREQHLEGYRLRKKVCVILTDGNDRSRPSQYHAQMSGFKAAYPDLGDSVKVIVVSVVSANTKMQQIVKTWGGDYVYINENDFTSNKIGEYILDKVKSFSVPVISKLRLKSDSPSTVVYPKLQKAEDGFYTLPSLYNTGEALPVLVKTDSLGERFVLEAQDNMTGSTEGLFSAALKEAVFSQERASHLESSMRAYAQMVEKIESFISVTTDDFFPEEQVNELLHSLPVALCFFMILLRNVLLAEGNLNKKRYLENLLKVPFNPETQNLHYHRAVEIYGRAKELDCFEPKFGLDGAAVISKRISEGRSPFYFRPSSTGIGGVVFGYLNGSGALQEEPFEMLSDRLELNNKGQECRTFTSIEEIVAHFVTS